MSTIYLSEEHMMYAIGKHYGGRGSKPKTAKILEVF
jgi:hypothetical protein